MHARHSPAPVSEAEGQTGEVASLDYEVMTTTIGDDVEFAEDGTFSFTFLTVGLSSDLAVKLTAVDRPAGVMERTINLTNDRTGPYLVITSPDDGGHHAKTVVIAGTVGNAEAEPEDTGELSSRGYEVLGTASAGGAVPRRLRCLHP